ncbi:MAG: NIPSNAP family protein [Rhodoferax sp.]|nr:NIPSNAP family protein [Rhodoferax sp.]MCB2008443.1 NIPSNAP family protein [Rhodoferax sp.]MCB2029047.1 NIPSNAP family protein [Rhodoferax sp.]MCB2039491.1 NIPSNAP family protein [Rhodoferax sp.]MCP5263607.1 NIPSNAP family protein [Rhodoferax sp.]
MLVEMRTYVLHAGKTAVFLDAMEREGLAIERPILGRLLGYYSTEIGTLNQIIHLWGYDSFEERTRRRQQLAQDRAWQRFVPTVMPFIRDMHNQLLTPAPFASIETLPGKAGT